MTFVAIRRRIGLVSAAALASGVACAQILGIEPWQPQDGGAAGGGPGGASSTHAATSSASSSTGSPLCSMLQSNCSACSDCASNCGVCEQQFSACNGDQVDGGCREVLQCLLSCGADAGCLSGCQARETVAPKRFPAYQQCLCPQCVASCPAYKPAGICP